MSAADEGPVMFPVPWRNMTQGFERGSVSDEHLPEMRSLVESCLHSEEPPREIQDILDDLERMVEVWGHLAKSSSWNKSDFYTNAGCNRDAARLIRVLYRKLEAKGD